MSLIVAISPEVAGGRSPLGQPQRQPASAPKAAAAVSVVPMSDARHDCEAENCLPFTRTSAIGCGAALIGVHDAGRQPDWRAADCAFVIRNRCFWLRIGHSPNQSITNPCVFIGGQLVCSEARISKGTGYTPILVRAFQLPGSYSLRFAATLRGGPELKEYEANVRILLIPLDVRDEDRACGILVGRYSESIPDVEDKTNRSSPPGVLRSSWSYR